MSKVKDAVKGSAGVLVSASRADGASETAVDIILRDIHIITMPHQGLIAVRNAYLKGPCEPAVLWNLRAGTRRAPPAKALPNDNDRCPQPRQNHLDLKVGVEPLFEYFVV